jgi:hypothetical protein
MRLCRCALSASLVRAGKGYRSDDRTSPRHAAVVIRVPVPMSASGGKADISRTFANVCF